MRDSPDVPPWKPLGVESPSDPDLILGARKAFIAGAGRSGLVTRAFDEIDAHGP